MSKHSTMQPGGVKSTGESEPPILSPPMRWALLAGLVLTVAGAIWYWNAPGRDELSQTLNNAHRALATGDFAEAYVLFQNALPKATSADRVPEVLAELAIRLRRFDDVDKWLDQMPANDLAGMSRIQSTAAGAALDVGQVTRAETWLRKLLRQTVSDPAQADAARQMLIRLYYLTHRERELRQLIAATDRAPENALPGDVLLQYCAGTRSGESEQDHVAWLKTAVQQEPQNAIVRAALVNALLRSNQAEAAREMVRQGIEQENSDGGQSDEVWRLKLLLAQEQIETGQFEAAAELLNALPEQADQEPLVWISRGRIAANRKNGDAARQAFAAAVVLDPLVHEAAYQQARLAQATGSSDVAQEQFRRVDLLDRLVKSATRARNTPRERQSALQEAATLTAQLGLPRLSLLLYRALALETPDSATLKQKVTELESNPQAKVLLAHSTPPALPDRKVFAPTRSATRNSAGLSPDSGHADGDKRTPEFRDVADATGFKFRHHFAETTNHWLMETLGTGVAACDFDLDGWPDIFCCQSSPLPVPATAGESAALFRNVRGEKFVETSALAGVNAFGFGQGCAVGDFDNDGWPDLLVCFYGSIRLYRNHGDGTFGDVTTAGGLSSSQWSTSAAFGDFDRDGDLDLYVVNYVVAPWDSIRPCDHGQSAGTGNSSTCRPTDYAAAQDSIWENRGDGTFVERTSSSGIVAADGKGLAVIVEDFNNDGWPDIYVANDMTPNHLFQNLGQSTKSGDSPFSFQERGVPAGAALNGQGEATSSMGLACGDADGDGYFDLFVTNFQEETNTYYHNAGSSTKLGTANGPAGILFSDDTAKARLLDLNPARMGWGCQFIDSLERGRLDLFVMNGHLLHTPQTPGFYSNEGERFRELRLPNPYFQKERMGRALATVDWNRDLKPDLVATYLKGSASLLTNVAKGGRSLGLQLVGRTANRDAEGARVTIQTSLGRRVYRVSRGGGYLSANDRNVLVGLGDGQSVERWEVSWPGGEVQSGGALNVGLRYRLIEGHNVQTITSL